MKRMDDDHETRTVSGDDEPLERAKRALEQLRAITFLGPNDPPLRFTAIEWHPDPLVRAKRGLARLREIKF